MASYNCTVSFSGDNLTLVTKMRNRTLTLNWCKARLVAKGEEEAVMARLDVLRHMHASSTTFTTEELAILSSLRDRTNTVATSTIAATAGAVATIVQRQGSSGADAMERGVNQRQAIVKALSGPLWLLIYDIPDMLKEEAPNPSPWFLPYGFRLNLSCWVMPQASLDSNAVQEVLKHWETIPGRTVRVNPRLPYTRILRVKHYTIKFAPDQLDTIRRIAESELRDFLIGIHTSLIERLDSADQRLREVEAEWQARLAADGEVTEKEMSLAQSRYDGGIRQTIRNANELFVGALESAKAFDQAELLADLFAGVRQAIQAEAAAFNARMQLAGRREVEALAA